MIFGSVCSGIEAASAAWLPLGWECAFVSEIEPFPCAVLAHHYPETPNRGDMTKFKEWPDANVDVLIGGTPCQSFSVAGLRKGLADPRGNLMLTYLAIADRLRPKWLVWENVPGVLSSNRGRDFGTFLGGLGELGYGFAYRVLDAQYFGVAQRRRRVFVVGYLGDWRRAAAVLFERESMSGNPPPSREKGKGSPGDVAARLRSGSGNPASHNKASGLEENLIANPLPEHHFRADLDNDTIIPEQAFGGNNTSGPINVATARNAKAGSRLDFESETFITGSLTARSGRNGGMSNDDLDAGRIIPMVTHSLRASFNASEDGTGRGTPLVAVAGTIGSNGKAAGSATSQDAESGLLVAVNAYGIDEEQNSHEEMMGCLKARTAGGGFEGSVATPTQVRRLTPEECEKLQGFPVGYTLIRIPKRNRHGTLTRAPWSADGPRYKALGNSMAVPVIAWLGRRIEIVEAMTITTEGES